MVQSDPEIALAEGVICSPVGAVDEGDSDTGETVVAVATLSTVAEDRGANWEGNVLYLTGVSGGGALSDKGNGFRVVTPEVAVSGGFVPTCIAICRGSSSITGTTIRMVSPVVITLRAAVISGMEEMHGSATLSRSTTWR